MKKFIKITLVAFGLMAAILACGQTLTFTNTYAVTEQLQLVQTVGINLVNVVSSLGPAYTNTPTWLSPWVDSQIYTNGLTTNNVKNIYVMWGGSGAVYNAKGIYQGIPPQWGGSYSCTLANAKTHVLPGERMHVLISVVDNSLTFTNIAANNNIVFNSSGMLYKVISIPFTTPPGF
jgi:hypothetical protein